MGCRCQLGRRWNSTSSGSAAAIVLSGKSEAVFCPCDLKKGNNTPVRNEYPAEPNPPPTMRGVGEATAAVRFHPATTFCRTTAQPTKRHCGEDPQAAARSESHQAGADV